MTDDKTHTIVCCLRVADARDFHKDSIVRICMDCGVEIYCMPHNYKEHLMCSQCVKKILMDKNTKIGIKPIDLLKAKEYLDEK